jgi:hypothetical protein
MNERGEEGEKKRAPEKCRVEIQEVRTKISVKQSRSSTKLILQILFLFSHFEYEILNFRVTFRNAKYWKIGTVRFGQVMQF